MTIRIEKLSVDLVANGQRFKKELASSEKDAVRWGKRIGSAVRVGTTAMIGMGVAVTALTAKLVKQADQIAKNAKAAGLGAETYQAWEFAASQNGVTNEKFAASMERATKRIGEAARGTGDAKKVLEQYGISIFDTAGRIRSTESIIRDFSDAMASMESPAERSAAAAAVLGREGIRLGLLLGQGAGKLKEFERQAKDLGLVISTDVLENAEMANDQFDIMQRVVSAQLVTGFQDFIPLVGQLSRKFADGLPAVAGYLNAILGIGSSGKVTGEILKTKEEIERLEGSIEELNSGSFISNVRSEGLVTAILFGDDINANNQAAAKKLEDKLDGAKQRLIKLHSDLVNIANNGGEAPGSDVGAGEVSGKKTKGKTFEELQAEAAERAYARRFEALTDFSNNYLEKTQSIIDIDNERIRNAIDAETELHQTKVSIAEDTFAVLGGLAKDGSALQKALFFAEKISAIARVRVNTEVAAVRALTDLGPVAGQPLAASIRLQGAVSQGLIAATAIAGQAHGGLNNVPREGTYLLNKGERVVQPAQNRDLTQFLSGRGGRSGGVVVQFIQAPGSSSRFDVTETQNGDEQVVRIEEIQNQVRRTLAEDVASGRGVAGAIEQTYGLTRRGVR